MSIHFSILGAGAWGTTVALLLARKPENHVTLWSARPESARLLQQRRENVDLLPGVIIPPSVHLTADIREATDKSGLLVAAIPTAYLRATMARVARDLPPEVPMLSLVKGIENESFLRPTEILQELTGPRPLAVLSGPSHAEEVSHGLPASVVVASEDLDLARWIQRALSTDRFRVYTNLDVVGVELAGALKNVIGIAAGISDGLALGDNAKAALLTRGLAEIARFGVALGAEGQTFSGLAGIGDLITTCMSRHGRNRHVGERLAQGERLRDIQASMKMVAEGVWTARSVHQRATQMGIPMPISEGVYRILYEDKDPRLAVTELMTREPTSEHRSQGSGSRSQQSGVRNG
jgi:glycerol-3-phosphate dehydrogenase (NAD(P)+)